MIVGNGNLIFIKSVTQFDILNTYSKQFILLLDDTITDLLHKSCDKSDIEFILIHVLYHNNLYDYYSVLHIYLHDMTIDCNTL